MIISFALPKSSSSSDDDKEIENDEHVKLLPSSLLKRECKDLMLIEKWMAVATSRMATSNAPSQRLVLWSLFYTFVLQNPTIITEEDMNLIIDRQFCYAVGNLFNIERDLSSTIRSAFKEYYEKTLSITLPFFVVSDKNKGLGLMTKSKIADGEIKKHCTGFLEQIPDNMHKDLKSHSSIIRFPSKDAYFLVCGPIQLVNHECKSLCGFQLSPTTLKLTWDEGYSFGVNKMIVCNYGSEYVFNPCFCDKCKV